MKTISNTRPINLKVVRFELDIVPPTAESLKPKRPPRKIHIPEPRVRRKRPSVPPPPKIMNTAKSRGVEELVEELLEELYAGQRDWCGSRDDYNHRFSSSAGSYTSSVTKFEQSEAIERSFLEELDTEVLRGMAEQCARRMREEGARLARQLRARDKLRRRQRKLCDGFSVLLRHASGDSGARFSVSPSKGGGGGGGGGGGADGEGEGGFTQWLHAMRLVARLPAGVPHHFRKKLWLTLAERHLSVRGVDWPAAERASFRGTAQPEDTELGAQIVKDLHRTGCSLFCGAEGRENQAMLRRVLLAYARWNKDVGYCQGFNMLAAIILEVMEKSESDSLKVMIYLVEAVLPEGYFADDLRGLSADMAAFRDLLRIRLPRLAQHMDRLQRASDGGGVEPPLPDVFTMQWFLTLYATWLPRGALLRVWDLVFLDGNEVLLLTALAIWDLLQDRILSARTADEFYSCMGGGAGAVYAAGEALVTRVVALGEAPELPRLRDLHRYHVTPPAAPPPPVHTAVQSVTRRGLKLFYSEDEGDSSDDGNRLALATVNLPRRVEASSGGERLSLDIGALKRQYARLRERQRQAHVILAAACARHAAVGVPVAPTSLTVNHLLLGKSAIVSSRGRRLGPPPGAVPPSRRQAPSRPSRARADDTISWKDEHHRRTTTRRESIKWKDIKKVKDDRKGSLESDEAGDGVIVSEREANEMMSAMRSRSMSESSSYSSRSPSSSTDTSLCDDNNRASDFDSEPASLDDNAINKRLDTNVKRPDEELIRLLPVPGVAKFDYCDDKIATCSENIENMSVNILDKTVPQLQGIPESPIDLKLKEVEAVSEFVSSTPGEQLRNYLEEFENRRNKEEKCTVYEDPSTTCSRKSPLFDLDDKKYKTNSDISSKSDSDLLGLQCSMKKDLMKTPEFYKISPTYSPSPTRTKLTEVRSTNLKSPYNYDFRSTYDNMQRRTNISENLSAYSRPPDIIDSLIMSPNFVPDIDLTERNLSDIESPLRSPSGESIVISEDEPPIPLKIDKYFEHSPEFFGARQTTGLLYSNEDDIPNRRAHKRMSRLHKKPDSLMLQCNLNEKLQTKTEYESSLAICESNYIPNSSDLDRSKDFSHSIETNIIPKYDKNEHNIYGGSSHEKEIISINPLDKVSILESGRRNSELALQIIQENSKILNRILTKQSTATSYLQDSDKESLVNRKQLFQPFSFPDRSIITGKIIESPVLKGSASDSLINFEDKPSMSDTEKTSTFLRLRPTSLDEPSSTSLFNAFSSNRSMSSKYLTKSPTKDDAIENKTDSYGWENKGFLAKNKNETNSNINLKSTTETKSPQKSFSSLYSDEFTKISSSVKEPRYDWQIHKIDSPSKIIENKSQIGIDHVHNWLTMREQSNIEEAKPNQYDFSQSSKYSDCLLSRASDICSRTLDRGPKVCENMSKSENTEASDFALIVTSSVSFSYDPSAGDDSPTAPKSNSSDTLCQITSLDQISTPISPKIFPKDTPTPKEALERPVQSSDDTSSQITSLLETETASSLSCPRSPSSGSYHPFPARPAIRMPKELGVRLGLYSRDSLNSSTK